ncbi:hypothetical protein [Clostridium sp. DL1XJH146]
MKNKYLISLLAILIFLLSGCENYKYPPGRDTRDYWGCDAEYQIIYEGLCNNKDDSIIEPVIHKYYTSGYYVYITGSKGYTILNWKTGEIKQNFDLNLFTDGEKEIFSNNSATIITEEEYLEFKLDNFTNKNGFQFTEIVICLGYSPEDTKTKDFLLTNKDEIINKTIYEWFDNNYDATKLDDTPEYLQGQLADYLMIEIPDISIQKTIMRYGISWS